MPVSSRITHGLLVLVVLMLVAVISMLATGVRGGPLDPGEPPASTMKSLDDIPGSWNRTLPADDGLPGPDPPAGCDSSRFECLEEFFNAVVLDRETGLVWYIEAGFLAPTTWTSAQETCLNWPTSTVHGARRGYRLPTYEELQSLSQAGGGFQLPPGHPFTVPTDDAYWTATSISDTNVRVFSFADGTSSPNGEPKTNENYFWCVRGGQGYDTK